MIHKTMHWRTARRIIGGAAAAIILAGCGTLWATDAHALPDPFVPAPPFWCPGNGPGLSASGYGGYCEGRTFPDGSRLNTFRVGYWWQPLRCIIPDGSPMPPLAGPGGCGGVLG